MLKELLEMNNGVREVFSEQIRGLIKAIEKKNFTKVAELLDRGADVNVKDRRKQTALMWAIMVKSFGLVKELVDRGADVNVKDREGRTAVLWASDRSNDSELIKFLVLKGADIKHKDNKGQSVLHEAIDDFIFPANFDVVKTLLELGADVNLRAQGRTPLEKGITPLSGIEQNINIVKLLLKHGADTEGILYKAVEWTAPMAVKVLLEFGVDVNGKHKAKHEGRTPLMIAILREIDINIVKLLLKHGADKNIKDNFGKSAWQMAARKGDKAILKVLVK